MWKSLCNLYWYSTTFFCIIFRIARAHPCKIFSNEQASINLCLRFVQLNPQRLYNSCSVWTERVLSSSRFLFYHRSHITILHPLFYTHLMLKAEYQLRSKTCEKILTWKWILCWIVCSQSVVWVSELWICWFPIITSGKMSWSSRL